MVMSNWRQRRRSQLPGLPAESDPVEHLLGADLEDGGHGTQLIGLLRNVTVLHGHPFRDLDAGQPGGLLDRQTGFSTGGLDTKTEQPAPDLAAQLGKISGGKGRRNILIGVLIYSLLLKAQHVKYSGPGWI